MCGIYHQVWVLDHTTKISETTDITNGVLALFKIVLLHLYIRAKVPQGTGCIPPLCFLKISPCDALYALCHIPITPLHNFFGRDFYFAKPRRNEVFFCVRLWICQYPALNPWSIVLRYSVYCMYWAYTLGLPPNTQPATLPQKQGTTFIWLYSAFCYTLVNL
ncbi:hypothetical protein CW304_32820 [Bacillus sp. UFRGS-B20]|nr:hypothetical protein CW304_32820 [Bacillus sp. UFRGS-B20]